MLGVQRLQLHSNNVLDINPLTEMEGLKELRIANNWIDVGSKDLPLLLVKLGNKGVHVTLEPNFLSIDSKTGKHRTA